MGVENPEWEAEEREYRDFCLRRCVKEASNNPRRFPEELEETALRSRINPGGVVRPTILPIEAKLFQSLNSSAIEIVKN